MIIDTLATAVDAVPGDIVLGLPVGHALADARSIEMLRATHDHKHGLRSGIVWSRGHATRLRYLRDIVITDSRFQHDRVKPAKAHGKLPARVAGNKRSCSAPAAPSPGWGQFGRPVRHGRP